LCPEIFIATDSAHAKPTQIAHACTSEIVKDELTHASPFAYGAPAFPEILYSCAVRTCKDKIIPLLSSDASTEQSEYFLGHLDGAATLVLGGTHIKPDGAGHKVNLPEAQGQELAFALSEVVSDGQQRPEP